MITIERATPLLNEHLGKNLRARHSIHVGYLMRHLALMLDDDADLWEVTGICHDLDFDVTKADRSRHGMVTADWLEGELPPVALLAIQAHDHRTGIVSDSGLADALKLADAIAVGEITAGRPAMMSALAATDSETALRAILVKRPFLPGMIVGLAHKQRLSLTAIAEICTAAPPQ